MQFRILGPLTAAFEGEALALGGERQRALLAVLLVHANEMVSTERLIEQLFGDTRAPGRGAPPTPSTSRCPGCVARSETRAPRCF